jgi:hypothetical protein
MESRLIMYHKQATSARTLFLRRNGTVCHLDSLPPESKVLNFQIEEGKAVSYPPTLVANIEQQLGLPSGILKIETDFQAQVDTSDSQVNVYLAEFTTTDAPYQQVSEIDCKLIAITEARSLPSVELELLKLAYSFLMDG